MISVCKSKGRYDANNDISQTLKILFFDKTIGRAERMENKFNYRLQQIDKSAIARNLIDILQSDAIIMDKTRSFVINWLRTGPDEKRKAFFDVWDLVLKSYLPSSRPVLFRSCQRKNVNGKIASFTGRLECARRFSGGKGALLICDTNELLEYETRYYKLGSYKHTFYPLVDLLKKAKNDGGWGFTERLLSEFVVEDEYIMRISPGHIHALRWIPDI